MIFTFRKDKATGRVVLGYPCVFVPTNTSIAISGMENDGKYSLLYMQLTMNRIHRIERAYWNLM